MKGELIMMIGKITTKAVVLGGIIMIVTAETISGYVQERKLEKRRRKIYELTETISDDDAEIEKLEKEVDGSMNEMKDLLEAAKAKRDMDSIEKRIEDIRRRLAEIDSDGESDVA